jgi:hypothetical protein
MLVIAQVVLVEPKPTVTVPELKTFVALVSVAEYSALVVPTTNAVAAANAAATPSTANNFLGATFLMDMSDK